MNEGKADICEVGYIDDNGEPQGWTFDCGFRVPAQAFVDNEMLYGGYTINELKKISNNKH